MSINTNLAGYNRNLPVANVTATGTISVGANVVANTSGVYINNNSVATLVQVLTYNLAIG